MNASTDNPRGGVGAGLGPQAASPWRPRTWPVLLALLAAVLVPAGCVVWFMHAAMRNELPAIRERLTEAYRARLLDAQREIDAYWDARAGELDARPGEGAGETFARLATSGLVDAAAVMDEQGRLLYPNPQAVVPAAATPAATTAPTTRPTATAPTTTRAGGSPATRAGKMPATQPAAEPATTRSASEPADWSRAEELEFVRAAPAAAAEVYARIAADAAGAGDTRHAARALLAQGRCLAKAGRTDAAVALLTGELEQARFRYALDAHGRLIVASARLMALELSAEPAPRRQIAQRLLRQVNDYRDLSLPAGQRAFVMTRLAELVPDAALPTLEAEVFAASVLPRLSSFDRPASVTRLMSCVPGDGRIEDLHATLLSRDRRVYGLYRGPRVRDSIERLVNRGPVGRDVVINLVNSVMPTDLPPPLLRVEASRRHMSDWALSLYIKDPDPFQQAARRQNRAYLWTGALTVAFISVLATAMGRYLTRQIRLTRLKNDFVATVSHELKTPLASMRVLVDTLRDGRYADARQPGEYLDLIAKENERLSRLIDNFLTFSRMERNRRAFEFAPVDVGEVVQAAAEAVRERFSSPGSQLSLEVAPGLPPVRADRDALVTVLLNLLDNAWKYSSDSKVVTVRAFAADRSTPARRGSLFEPEPQSRRPRSGGVSIEVSDNGPGMSRRAQRRIFDRFYQADRTLSRQAGGCGLGLSIVKFILDAHGGSIDVKSRPGEGSTFTVRLPAAEGPTGGEASG